MKIPEKGFYVHYKHNPLGALHNYMYEVIGMGRNTEDEAYTVLYRPLYESDWMAPAVFQSRPVDMFWDEVEKDGAKVPRFKLITDPNLIEELEEVKKVMYPRLI